MYSIVTAVALLTIATLLRTGWCQQPTSAESPIIAADTANPGPAPSLGLEGSTCYLAKSCGQCIARGGCAWCVPDNVTKRVMGHCLAAQDVGGCEGSVEDPQSLLGEVVSPAVPEEYSMFLTPSRVKLKLRVGQTVDVPLQLHISANWYLDLYYLTDVSMSMRDDLQLLQKIGRELEETMKNKTTKFSMGFGTFIDKNTLPYNYNDSLQSEAGDGDSGQGECHGSFSFCNAMALQEDGGERFIEAVKAAAVASNKDFPEGGLDALLQVLVCTEQVRWRESASKMVLYATDAAFHYAGDGRLAGIDEVNDGKCHLDAENKAYTHSLLQDYPSVAQISAAGDNSGIYVIFAVTKKVLRLYEELQQHVPGSRTAEITEDSSNIINIIVEQFNNIVSTVLLTTKHSDELVNVTFSYNCPGGSPDACRGLTLGDVTDVTAHVTLLQCPTAHYTTGNVSINSTGLNEEVLLELEYLCDCACQEHTEPSSAHCSSHGGYTCGQCSCDQLYYGSQCQCSGSEADDTRACLQEAGGRGDVCSGRGECVCGVCECNKLAWPKRYEGDHCECSNFDCRLEGGLPCGGRGRCECNRCLCDDGWSGDGCSCATATDGCSKEPGSTELCSGHGDCVCNSCQCWPTGGGDGGSYFGKWCHDCATCGGNCGPLSACVRCHLKEAGDGKLASMAPCEDLPQQCLLTTVVTEDVSSAVSSTLSECSMTEGDCSIIFYYKRSNTTLVWVSKAWTCPIKTWVLALIIVATMVATGAITCIVGMAVQHYVNGRAVRHVAALGKESIEHASAEVNRIYRAPKTTTINPMFGQKM